MPGDNSDIQPTEPKTSPQGRPVSRPVEQLQLHPGLTEIDSCFAFGELNQAAKADGDFTPREPVLITTTGIVLAGFGLWKVALFQGAPTIECIEYPLDEEQALIFMLGRHRTRRGWNAFVRIEVALKLESSFRRVAIANQQAGGKQKGSAILPEALDVREKIAKIAGVCPRNVSKVKEILKSGHARLIDCLRQGSISINSGNEICKLPKAEQQDRLGSDLLDRVNSRTIRLAITGMSRSDQRLETISLLDELRIQELQNPGFVDVRVSKSPQTVIYVGQDLLLRQDCQLKASHEVPQTS